MAGRSAGDVLLELLELVPDAETLERLLEPPNLLAILRAKGWTDDDVRADLAARSPGELLLDVLRNDSDVQGLLRVAGVQSRSVAVAAPAGETRSHSAAVSPSAAAPAPHVAPLRAETNTGVRVFDVFDPKTRLEAVGGVLVLVAAVVPSMFVAGSLPDVPRLDVRVAAILAAVGGAIGGAFYGRVRRATAIGVGSGAVAAAGSAVASWVYLGLRGPPGSRLELIVVVFLGLLPGALLYALAARGHARVR
jgi:hypothetical protein